MKRVFANMGWLLGGRGFNAVLSLVYLAIAARQAAANTTRSSVRARVEHVFGSQHTSMGGKLVRTIGIVRAAAKIGMQNLAYNMRRMVVLERGMTTAA